MWRRDLQALRAIAVLAVVVFHAWPQWLPGGYVGVDVFFVVSGYLITTQLITELETSGRIDFWAFYARRIRRLLPAAMLVIAATVLVFGLTHSLLEARQRVAGAVAALLYVSNLWLAWRSVDYLAQEEAGADPLLHLWSLAVEEQFYLVWPALLLVAWLWGTRRGAPQRMMAWVLGIVMLASLAICVVLTSWAASWAYFSLPARAWEFGFGALAVLLRPAALRLPPGLRRLAVGLGLAGIAAAVGLFTPRTAFPGVAALLPVTAAFLVIAAGGEAVRMGRADPMQSRAMVWLGDRSYALYLWHWPVLIGLADLWPAVWPAALAAPAGLAASLLLADVTTRWIENPVRFHARFRTPRAAWALGAALMASTLALVLASPLIAPAGQDVAARRAAELAIRDRPRLYDERCFAPALAVEPPPCVYGDPAATRTVVLLGDSHAAQWFPALEAWARDRRLRIEVFVKAACPVAAVEPFDPKLGRAYTECTAWREQVFARLARLQPALVIASQASTYDPFVSGDTAAMAQWQQALTQSFDRLASLSQHVALVRDTPLPAFHVPRCLAREAAAEVLNPNACRFPRDSTASTRALAAERAAAAGRAQVSLLDVNTDICPGTTCSPKHQGQVLFHDTQHLSARAAQRLAEPLWQQLPPAVRQALADH